LQVTGSNAEGDAANPGRQGAVMAELVQFLVNPQKNFLTQFFSVITLLHHAIDHMPDQVLVLHDQALEGAWGALEYRLHQGTVVFHISSDTSTGHQVAKISPTGLQPAVKSLSLSM